MAYKKRNENMKKSNVQKYNGTKIRRYTNCNIGEIKELEGAYITNVYYCDDYDGTVTIIGTKKTPDGLKEVSFWVSGGKCYKLVDMNEYVKNEKNNSQRKDK